MNERSELEKLRAENAELKTMLKAFQKIKEGDETAMLNNIANDLDPYFADFAASYEEEMDVELGEIYREQLNNIFKLLKRHGIRPTV